MQVLFLQRRAGKAGAQVCLAALVKALRRLGLEARVLLGQPGWLAEVLQQEGALAGIVPFPSWRSPLARILRLAPFFIQTRRLGRSQGLPQLLHANDLWEALLTEWLARRWQRPWVVHLRTQAPAAQLQKYHLHRAKAVIAVSPVLPRNYDAAVPLPWHYLPDGLSRDEFWPLTENPAPFPRHLGVMGHDDPAKGWEDLGQALALVHQHQGRLPAKIVFFGRCRPAAQERLRAIFPATIKLIFAGLVTDPLPPLWRQLDLIIIPSRRESFGRSALEVIAAGVPILASRTGIIPWLLGPESPWTFPPADPSTLAAVWQNLPAIWDRRTAFLNLWRQRLEEDFLLEKVALNLTCLYSKIISGSEP